jgi:tetratricopeptide (TPR) repeat protein
LKIAYEVLGASRPEAALLIRKTDELESEVVEQRYRDACARYHPDRYLGSNQAVRALAEGCFGRISESYHHLKDPLQFEQARERLVFRETGKRPVNDKTRARARVDFKRAEMRFRQRRYEDAVKVAERAVEGDPARWEYRYLQLRSAWHAGTENTETVVTGIIGLEGMDSISRGEALYVAGEMWLKDGRTKQAYDLFKQAVGVDPENVGARRRIRLKESRKRESAKESSGAKKAGKPLFGGVFGRRGD